MCSYIDVALYYKVNFSLTRNEYSESEIDNMYPFERDIKLLLLNDYIEELKKNIENDRQ